MIKQLMTVVIFGLLSAAPVLGHGPTPQVVEETITIDKPAAAVWKVLQDFGGLASWHPLVADCAVRDGERTITFKGGGALVDSLDEIDSSKHTYSYRLMRENVEALPVSFYTATIVVESTGATASSVVWSARFYRGDTHNEPPEHLSDAAALAAMKGFLAAGLRGLKAKME